MSLRIAFFSISFFGFLLISLYRAMLGASLAIKLYREPVSSLEELLDSDLKVAIAANSSIQDYFSKANSTSIQAKIWREKLQNKDSFLSSTFNFTEKLAQNEVSDTILFGVFQSISGYGGHYPCRIQSVKRDYRKIDNGMIYQKNWPFTRLFNFHLFKMHERGVLRQIQNKHLEYSKTDCGLSEPRTIGLVNVASLAVLLTIGYVLAVLTFILEFCSQK